jgi:hypothetical protein
MMMNDDIMYLVMEQLSARNSEKKKKKDRGSAQYAVKRDQRDTSETRE